MSKMSFAKRYGPWALVAGASDGVGQAFAEALAGRGLNVVLLARRQGLLEEVAEGIRTRHGVETRAIAMDLAAPDAAAQAASAVADLEVGFLVYCAGAQADHKHFLDAELEAAESMLHRNCTVPMQMCHLLGRESFVRPTFQLNKPILASELSQWNGFVGRGLFITRRGG